MLPHGYMIQNGWNPALLGMPPPIAGTKRKSPPPPSNTHANEQRQHTPAPPAAQQQISQQPTRPPQPPLGSSHVPPDPIRNMAIKFDYQGSLQLQDTDPGLQPWPNSTGPHPTLTGGLGGATLSVCEFILVSSNIPRLKEYAQHDSCSYVGHASSDGRRGTGTCNNS